MRVRSKSVDGVSYATFSMECIREDGMTIWWGHQMRIGPHFDEDIRSLGEKLRADFDIEQGDELPDVLETEDPTLIAGMQVEGHHEDHNPSVRTSAAPLPGDVDKAFPPH